MITKIKFNSQICTSREQSERLLALGLKKETADMCYKVTTHDFKGNEINEIDRHYTLCCWYDESSLVCGLERKETIPAWSLHRLIGIYNYNQNNNGKYIFDSTYLEHCYNQIIHDISIKIQKGELEDLVQ